nr:hypothetical protein BaRGS_001798 [Batillaria attramentaria]
MPEFVNAAFGLPVDATNTCGVTKETEYCLQTGVTGARKPCYICDARQEGLNHPPEFMTDFNKNYSWTWWQSETMLEGVQYPNTVNLTLHLRKAFDITYVRIRFTSPRPESFAIYKRTREDSPWIPYQFYSASCQSTYSLPRRGVITSDNEAVAICTDEFSDISPLTGGSVAFSTLEGRPSAFEFSESPVLQEWVTATDIKIVLTRMNTFGDEVFGDPRVLKSYFYAISDLAVGARCKCNGHGSSCEIIRDQMLEDRLVCQCEHNTAGPDCGECLPFYNDRPWARATERDANECQPCDCNGLSNRCYFDRDLYLQTGHGGHCEGCSDNTSGPHCEFCMENHYRRMPENRCLPCGCNEMGSESLQCDDQGQCRCKPGVGGERCDRCLPDYFDFSENGCQPCACVAAGSLNNEPRCDTRTGECSCKENVEGRRCDRCKPGFFGLSEENPFGCLSCFCYGHSSVCDSAPGFFGHNITTDFETGKQRWTAVSRSGAEVDTQFNGVTEKLGVSAPSSEVVYFFAPERYLGDQRFSYNQFLTFELQIGEETARPSVVDIVIEGSGQSIATHIFAQSNPVPGVQPQYYAFRLHEDPDYQWSPRLKAQDFISILSNVTAVKIRATYSPDGVGFIDNIQLGTARQGFNTGPEALWVEQCTCPDGYIGQFCESCAPGYRRDVLNGGSFARCVPCECNGHSDICDVNTGRCICQHNTEGANCERCARGFFGDPTNGTPDDCQPCPCPNDGPCVQLPNQDVVCTECAEGYGGNLCDLCLDGYSGDPTGRYGNPRPCSPCSCNGNIDPNAVGNCNTTTGECLKCIYNTGGFYCDACLPSFYGDALAEPKGQCQACNCYPSGTIIQPGVIGCDPGTGQCPCLPNVGGRQCNRCEPGYWNLDSGNGCEPCDCDRVGSTNYTCEQRGGQCQCKTGVTGRRCDTCERFYYGFSQTGCQACNCDPIGSLDLQCDQYGYCPCRPNVDGRRCDRCQENKYNMAAGCLDCPQCYDLVQEQVNIHRGKLRDLTTLINNIGNNPSLFNDSEFLSVLGQVNNSINVLLDEARSASTGDGTIGQQLQELKDALRAVLDKCGTITRSIAAASDASKDSIQDIEIAEAAIRRAEQSLREANDYIGREGRQALAQALEALQQFGKQSQQMTEIAQRATNESMRQMNDAKMIDNVARNALNTSREALRLAEETLKMPETNRAEIERLSREFQDASELYDRTEELAQNALERANEAHEEALNLFREAQDPLPNIDVASLSDQATQIREEANRIRMRAQQLLQSNQQLLQEVADQRNTSRTMLDEGYGLQRRVDELLADVDSARAVARKAVQSGEQTLREANETLQTLLEFDQLVAENKGKADEALQKVPEIERMIRQALETTQQARDALRGAVDDAKEGLRLADLAEQTATEASNEARRIRDEARETKDKAVNLKEEASTLSQEVVDAESRLTDYENQATQDEGLIDEAHKKAAAAQLTANKTAMKVNEALDQVTAIRNILEYLEDVDTDKLAQLEEDLARLEEELNRADIEAELTQLQEQNEKIKCWREKYETDLSQFKKDVENIMAIRDSLPNECFKTIDIESPQNG